MFAKKKKKKKGDNMSAVKIALSRPPRAAEPSTSRKATPEANVHSDVQTFEHRFGGTTSTKGGTKCTELVQVAATAGVGTGSRDGIDLSIDWHPECALQKD